MPNTTIDRASTHGRIAALLSLIATIVTGAACLLPLIAIVLGVGGLGWLTRFSYLRVPASMLTCALLAYGFASVYRRPRADCAARSRRRSLQSRVLLWTAAVVALVIHVAEYVVLPHLL